VSDVEVGGPTPAAPGVERRWLTSRYPVRSDGEIAGASTIYDGFSLSLRCK